MVAVSLFSLNYLVFDVMCITVLHVYTYVLISIIIIGNKLDEHKLMRQRASNAPASNAPASNSPANGPANAQANSSYFEAAPLENFSKTH